LKRGRGKDWQEGPEPLRVLIIPPIIKPLFKKSLPTKSPRA